MKRSPWCVDIEVGVMHRCSRHGSGIVEDDVLRMGRRSSARKPSSDATEPQFGSQQAEAMSRGEQRGSSRGRNQNAPRHIDEEDARLPGQRMRRPADGERRGCQTSRGAIPAKIAAKRSGG